MRAGDVDRGAYPYRMKDLCDLTGLERQAIHFYIQEGLVPEGRKTGRNMAFYGEEHVERIKLIRQLQEERFLPLRAIRAVLDERDDAFTPAQKRLLRDVKTRLAGRLAPRKDAPEAVDAEALLARCGLDARDLEELVAIGLVGVSGPKGKRRVAEDDVWILELWGDVRRLGFSRELGFDGRVLAIYEEAISAMFEKETAILTERLSHLPAQQVATMVERVMPLVGAFLARYHETKARNFFTAI